MPTQAKICDSPQAGGSMTCKKIDSATPASLMKMGVRVQKPREMRDGVKQAVKNAHL